VLPNGRLMDECPIRDLIDLHGMVIGIAHC
jgi:hypothetical protein